MKYLGWFTVALVIVLSGCAYLGPQSNRHVIEDWTGVENVKSGEGRIGTFALVAQRRMVLVKFANGNFCAEPPPDAVDNLSQSLSAALSANTKGVEVSGSIAAAFASYAKQLFYRTQGLQLYRDGMFSMCTNWLNGVIKDEKTLLEKQDALLKASTELIKAEIPELKNIKADLGGTPSLPTPSIPPSLPADADKTPIKP